MKCYADCSLLKFEDSVISGRSQVKANLSEILQIVFKLDMGLKLAGSFTSIPAVLSSGETWASLNCVEKRPWLKDILASLAIRGAKTPLHRFNTDVGTKSMGDDSAGMVFRCFITSSTVAGVNSVSWGLRCAPSKKNGL